MRPLMVAGGEGATKAPVRARGRGWLLPRGVVTTALAGAALAFGTLVIIEDAAVAATAAAVVAGTLLVSENLLRRPRQKTAASPVPAALSLDPAPEHAETVEVERPAPALAPAPAAASVGVAEAKLAALCDYVKKLPDLFAIMKEHTRNVIADTERASYDFVDNINEVDKKIRELKEFLLVSQNNISAIDLAKNDALIDQIRLSFAQNSDLIASIIDERSGFSTVVETMRRLHQELAVIGEIARRIKLLALNASIEAARASQYGAGFAVHRQGDSRALRADQHRHPDALAADRRGLLVR